MSKERIGTAEAATILKVGSGRAALLILKKAGVPIAYEMEFDRFRKAMVSRSDVERLAQDRKNQGLTGARGRPARCRKSVAA